MFELDMIALQNTLTYGYKLIKEIGMLASILVIVALPYWIGCYIYGYCKSKKDKTDFMPVAVAMASRQKVKTETKRKYVAKAK